MESADVLKNRLSHLDGQDYGEYQQLRGGWSFVGFDLYMDRIPKDPFAPPGTGVYRARVPARQAGFTAGLTSSPLRTTALRDYLARRFLRQCQIIGKGGRGTGHSGIITLAGQGQAILERTSIIVTEEWVEARFFVGLPAQRRKIRAKVAETMLFGELPEIVRTSLLAESLDSDEVEGHVATAEDAQFLRDSLASAGLVAFVGDGAVLPRASGIDPRPLDAEFMVPFASPDSLRTRFDLPNAGPVTGMGIPPGVTVIVGGGYHGKSTLLQALELGIYNHIPNDGRELCVCLPDAVKVRAANGRSVAGTDISAFIAGIPLGAPTTSFSTSNASGSTSQAAFVAEAIEAGATLLLMDEDTSATNFMIRDKRMQELVAKANEPITAFVDKVRQLYEVHGISTIMVMGGSGDYFGLADCVIQMNNFVPFDVTGEAHAIARRFKTGRTDEGGAGSTAPRRRMPVGDDLNPHNDYGKQRVSASSPWRLTFGQSDVDLSDVEQLVESAQTRAIGQALLHTRESMDGKTELAVIAARLGEEIDTEGLDVLDPGLTGQMARFRPLEFAAALNRMRALKVVQKTQ